MVWPINHVETEISVPRNTYITIIVKILYATQKWKFTLICPGMVISFASMVYCSLSVTPCFWFRVCLPVLHIRTMLTAQPYTVPTLLQAYIIWENKIRLYSLNDVRHVQKKGIWCSRQFVLYSYPSNSAIFKCTWNCALIVTCYTFQVYMELCNDCNMLHRHLVTCFITIHPHGVVCSAINFFLIIFSKYKPTGYMRKPKITTNISQKPST